MKRIGVAWFTRTAIVLILAAGIVAGCASAPPKTSEHRVAKLSKNARPGDVPVEIMEMRTPKYPDVAMENDIQGKVIVEVLVTEDGRIGGMKVVKRELNKYLVLSVELRRWVDVTEIFDASVYDMLKDTKWKPSLRDGKPIAVRVIVPFIFDLHR